MCVCVCWERGEGIDADHTYGYSDVGGALSLSCCSYVLMTILYQYWNRCQLHLKVFSVVLLQPPRKGVPCVYHSHSEGICPGTSLKLSNVSNCRYQTPLPKGYSCIHSKLQSQEFQRHESDWSSAT